VETALQKFGPIMVGGNFGQLMGGLISNLGHFVVLAGVKTDPDGVTQLKIHDPWENVGPKWVPALEFSQKAWGDGESFIAVRPPPAVNS
jgi:hypothetical protein